ncbi:MAG: hypothetical protein QNI95_09565 [Desulfobacterales bacterium]|nr:hypothetical protein [Desulfobacterales bacterium]
MLRTKYSDIHILAIFVALLFIGACSEISLQEYASKNQDEAAIISVLRQYQDARNNFELEKYLDCLHDRGFYHYASSVMVSKQDLHELLPRFWVQLQKGDRLFFPMCRENISGNYFVGFRIVNPQIVMHHDAADVTVTYLNKGWRQRHYISMVKENGRWLINRLDWETG